jgi:hypothetical protein
MEQYGWNDLLKLSSMPTTPLARHPKCQHDYQLQKHYVKVNYKSYNDFIKIHILGWDYRIEKCKKVAVPAAAFTAYAITPNPFPYNVQRGINHYILWCVEQLTEDQIDAVLSKHYIDSDSIWMVNTIENRSVKGVWHAHIFSKQTLTVRTGSTIFSGSMVPNIQ